MNKTLKIAIPVVAGVVAAATGIGVAAARSGNQNTTYTPTSYNTIGTTPISDDDAWPQYCGGVGMMGSGVGLGLQVTTERVATLLGTTTADLKAQLESGKTLADIAKARGVSNDMLVQTIVAPLQEHLDIMVKYGYLTKDQAVALADQAHEMSTPLAVMQSNLEGMLDGVVETSPANVASLHEEALLLSRLVKDLRTLSQAEAGKLNLFPAPGDLVGLVSSLVRATEPEARRKHVSLEFRSEPDLPKAMMDPDRVSQVVANLLSNALRYTSDGDSIEVAVARYEGNGNAGPGLLVSVADTGQGISEQDIPHIFDRYYQGAQPREKRAGGSGIGLAVVKELVEAHKGKVWVNSAPGEGSTFFFTLPIA